MKAEIKGENLVITLPMQSPSPSASGKMVMIATTGGFKDSGAVLNDKAISISINAGYKP